MNFERFDSGQWVSGSSIHICCSNFLYHRQIRPEEFTTRNLPLPRFVPALQYHCIRNEKHPLDHRWTVSLCSCIQCPSWAIHGFHILARDTTLWHITGLLCRKHNFVHPRSWYAPSVILSIKSISAHWIYLGMGLVTSVPWLFYFIIGITWPSYVKAFKPFGAFMWYCIYLCVPFPSSQDCPLVLTLHRIFVPETQGKELEDLDETFNISTKDFAGYDRDRAFYAVKRYVFRQDEAIPSSPPAPRPTELALLSTSTNYRNISRE